VTGFYEGDGTEAEPIPHGLNTHTDVSITGPQNNEVLKYSASTGSWYNGSDVGASTTKLDDLQDTAVPSPTDGNALVWNETAARWVDATIITGAAGQLSDLSDVDFPIAPVEGQILLYTGGIWTAGSQEANAIIPNPLKVGDDTGDSIVTLAAGGGVSDSGTLTFNKAGITAWSISTGGAATVGSLEIKDADAGVVFSIPKTDGSSTFGSPLQVFQGGLDLGIGIDSSSIGITLNGGTLEGVDTTSLAFNSGQETLFELKTGITTSSVGAATAYNLGLFGKNDTNLLRVSTDDEGATDVSLTVVDRFGNLRNFLLGDTGVATFPGTLNVKSGISGQSSGLWLQNFDWNSGDGGYHLYAAKGPDTNSALVIAPRQPSSIGGAQYSGEVDIYVGATGGSGGGTEFGWQFGNDGALWRWAAGGWSQVIPPP